MIRNIEEKDMSLINELTTIVRYDIDFAHSAINFDENGKLKALVLTSEKPLIEALPRQRFPRIGHHKVNQITNYKKEKNHKILFLYRTERNGRALASTLQWLQFQQTPRGSDLWWLDGESPYITKNNLNKISGIMFLIKKTTMYYGH